MIPVDLHYGSGRLQLNIPDGLGFDEFAPRRIDQPLTYDEFVCELEATGGPAALADESPLIIVNDGYRSTPTAVVLDWLNKYDASLIDRSRFLVATGTHDAPTETHHDKIFGPFLPRVRDRLARHDCRDYASMTKLTDDPLGGEVLVNKAVFERGRAVIIGSVEPHYFAGYTGGRKSLFPGLVDLKTTERNHNLAVSLDAAPLRLDGNPVAEHLDGLLKLIDTGRYYSIQVVSDIDHRPAGVSCGGIDDSFERATELARKIYAHRISQPYDLIIAELRPPLDSSLYQMQKAVENCQAAVADTGTLIVVSACKEGIGSPHFYELARKWDRQQNQPVTGTVSFGSHKLSRVITISKRIDLLVYSEVEDEDVRQVFYEPLDNVQEFLYSLQNDCEKCNVAVVYDAGHTVLQI